MITILFWNIHQNAVDENLIRLINRWQVDLFLLAESPYVPQELLDYINPRTNTGTESFAQVKPQNKNAKVHSFARIPRANWQNAFPHARYEAWTFQQAGETILLAAVHFPDIRYEQGDGQRKTAIQLRQDIERYESGFFANQQAGETPIGKIPLSLLIGDFNANPFDAGIAGFYGLNASAHREIVEKHGARQSGGQTVKFYYNPMWRFLGSAKTPGTFFDRLSSPVSYDWFILDQVLLSPGLLDYVKDDNVAILDWDTDEGLGGFPLTRSTKEKPLAPIATISDHLPIVLQIDL